MWLCLWRLRLCGCACGGWGYVAVLVEAGAMWLYLWRLGLCGCACGGWGYVAVLVGTGAMWLCLWGLGLCGCACGAWGYVAVLVNFFQHLYLSTFTSSHVHPFTSTDNLMHSLNLCNSPMPPQKNITACAHISKMNSFQFHKHASTSFMCTPHEHLLMHKHAPSTCVFVCVFVGGGGRVHILDA